MFSKGVCAAPKAAYAYRITAHEASACSFRAWSTRLGCVSPSECLLTVQGIIINGCIRDSEDISKMPLGVKALNTYPLKSSKRDHGLSEVPVTVAGTTVKPGDWIYADKDGILVSTTELSGQ